MLLTAVLVLFIWINRGFDVLVTRRGLIRPGVKEGLTIVLLFYIIGKYHSGPQERSQTAPEEQKGDTPGVRI